MTTKHRTLTDAQFEELRAMYARGETRQAIANHFGFPVSALFDRNRESRGKGRLPHPGLAHLPRRQGMNGGRPAVGSEREWASAFEPPPAVKAQVRLRTEEVQARWSPEERMARRVTGFTPGTSRHTAREPDLRPKRRHV
jgi:hypothetical protein